MNENTSANSLEPKLDAVLSEFFQQEMPPGLGHGALNWSEAGSMSVQATVQAQADVLTPPVRSAWQRRLPAVIAVATVAACATLLIRPVTEQAASNGVVENVDEEQLIDEGDNLMLVSPNGDSSNSDDAVVGDHGLTIGETDDVDLSPTAPGK